MAKGRTKKRTRKAETKPSSDVVSTTNDDGTRKPLSKWTREMIRKNPKISNEPLFASAQELYPNAAVTKTPHAFSSFANHQRLRLEAEGIQTARGSLKPGRKRKPPEPDKVLDVELEGGDKPDPKSKPKAKTASKKKKPAKKKTAASKKAGKKKAGKKKTPTKKKAPSKKKTSTKKKTPSKKKTVKKRTPRKRK